MRASVTDGARSARFAASSSLDRAELRALTERCRDLCYSAVRTIAALPDRERRFLTRLDQDGIACIPSNGQPAPSLSVDDVWQDPEWGAESAKELRKHKIEEQARKIDRYHPDREEIGRCLQVLGWLTWLERERHGKAERQIIAARAFGISYASLAKRFGRSDQTISRWEDAGIWQIALHFRAEIEALS